MLHFGEFTISYKKLQNKHINYFLKGCPANGSSNPHLKDGPLGFNEPFTTFNALHNEMQTMITMMAQGKALTIPIVLIAVKLSFPPATSKAEAVAPSINAQKTRCAEGGSGMPFAERQSITKDPESEEVTKYKMMENSENADRNSPIPVYDRTTSNHICSIGWQESLLNDRSLVTLPKSSPKI